MPTIILYFSILRLLWGPSTTLDCFTADHALLSLMHFLLILFLLAFSDDHPVLFDLAFLVVSYLMWVCFCIQAIMFM